MLVEDGIKFVENFSWIIGKSTPHLYLSALPFSPSKSILATSLLERFPGIAQVVVGKHDDWPRSHHAFQAHGPVNSVAFCPVGRYIAAGIGISVQLWDAQTGDQVGKPF